MNGQTNLGSIIAQLRRSEGWTQADLAQKLGITAQADPNGSGAKPCRIF